MLSHRCARTNVYTHAHTDMPSTCHSCMPRRSDRYKYVVFWISIQWQFYLTHNKARKIENNIPMVYFLIRGKYFRSKAFNEKRKGGRRGSWRV